MSQKFSKELPELYINLGGHPVLITDGTIEFEEEGLGIDTLAGALLVEDRRNVAVGFPELIHKETIDNQPVTVSYGLNAERVISDGTEVEEVEEETPKAKAKK